jgi:hypothetical protein
MDAKKRFSTETERPRRETYGGGSRSLLVEALWSIIRVHSCLFAVPVFYLHKSASISGSRCFFAFIRGPFFARIRQVAQNRDSN